MPGHSAFGASPQHIKTAPMTSCITGWAESLCWRVWVRGERTGMGREQYGWSIDFGDRGSVEALTHAVDLGAPSVQAVPASSRREPVGTDAPTAPDSSDLSSAVRALSAAISGLRTASGVEHVPASFRSLCWRRCTGSRQGT